MHHLLFTPYILQVLLTMEQLEKVNTFQEFVQIFSQFGNEMVEFAHLTGDRQNVSTQTQNLCSKNVLIKTMCSSQL